MNASGRTRQSSDELPADEIGEIPENLFREPLEVIRADHFRTLVACRMLSRLIDSVGRPVTDGQVILIQHYLLHDLPIHFADEEEDLFPLLRARYEGDHGVNAMLSLLAKEHARNEALATVVIAYLEQLAAKKRSATRLRCASTLCSSMSFSDGTWRGRTIYCYQSHVSA